MFYINQKTLLSNTFLLSNPFQNIGKSFNNLKYVFDVTNSNAENFIFHIFSPNFDNNFYPDLSFIEYNIVSDQSKKINLKITDFNIEKYGDMLYILNKHTNDMRLIQTDDFLNTECNEIAVYFKTDCFANEGKFKIIVNFIQNNDQITTETIQTNIKHTTHTNNNYEKQTTVYLDTTITTQTNSIGTTNSNKNNKETTTDYLDTTETTQTNNLTTSITKNDKESTTDYLGTTKTTQTNNIIDTNEKNSSNKETTTVYLNTIKTTQTNNIGTTNINKNNKETTNIYLDKTKTTQTNNIDTTNTNNNDKETTTNYLDTTEKTQTNNIDTTNINNSNKEVTTNYLDTTEITQTSSDKYTTIINNSNEETTTYYLNTTNQTSQNYVDSTINDYITTKNNSGNFETSTISYITSTQTKLQTEVHTNDNTLKNFTTCSNITVNLLRSGNIFSPNYPDPYPKDSYCKWLLKSNENKRFKLTINSDMFFNDNDYILLYNSSTVRNETLFAALNGKTTISEFVSPESEILIVFVSDDKDYYFGFQYQLAGNTTSRFLINYYETSEPQTKISKPGEQINGKGIIFAPNQNINHKGLNKFNWTLKTVDNKKFKLKVHFSNLLYRNDFDNYDLYDDYLAIYEGEKKEQIAGLTWVDRYIEYIFYSNSDQVFVNCTFSGENNSRFNYISFSIEYEEINEPYLIKQTSTCDDFLYLYAENSFYVLGIPTFNASSLFMPYGNNLNCSWSLSVKYSKIVVFVVAIGKNDVLSIYNGNSATNTSLIRSFTNMFPPHADNNEYYDTYNSFLFYIENYRFFVKYEFYTDSDLYVTFNTDNLNSAMGFYIATNL